MIRGKKCELNSLDLNPLPYESSLSSLWRLAWRNAMTGINLRKICATGNMRPSGESFLQHKWLKSSAIAATTGWEIPEESEISVFDTFTKFEKVFFDSNLCICPICLECGYHSFWFQFTSLKLCPIHNTPIENRCQSCGVNLPEYRFSLTLMRKAYYCEFCKQPICGMAPDLQLHLDLREQKQIIEVAFFPLMKWAMGSHEGTTTLREINRFAEISGSMWKLWSRHQELFKAIGCLHNPLPEYCNTLLYESLTVLTWRIKIAKNSGLINSNLFPNAHSIRFRARSLNLVYRSTLRMLDAWIDKKHSCFSDESEIKLFTYIKGGQIDLAGWKTSELAYILMRLFLEPEYSSDRLSTYRDAQLRFDQPSVWIKGIPERGPRIAWRAVILGFYAAFFHMVERSRPTKTLNLINIMRHSNYLVVQRQYYVEQDYIYGTVIFPTIDSFPVFPFKGNRQRSL